MRETEEIMKMAWIRWIKRSSPRYHVVLGIVMILKIRHSAKWETCFIKKEHCELIFLEAKYGG